MRKRIGGGNEDRKLRVDGHRVAKMYRDGSTIKEIAIHCGVSVQPIRRILDEWGVRRRAAAPRAGTITGSNNPAWRGGRRIRSDGYVVVWTPCGQRLEHRVVMERHIGRALRDDEVVHHTDDNRSNNNIDNLELLASQTDHAAKHATKNRAILLRGGLKQCTKCLLIKPVSEFYKTRHNRMGIQSWCRHCKNMVDAERRRKKGP